tara:strand:+ start:127 stop:429 length:303 start_codon:yes stop_codon:yes gene_type:complete
MNREMMAYCGTYCETCDWKEKMNCKGCKAHASEVFWGTCKIAECAIEKGIDHCGECHEVPCEKLKDAYNNAEHGDNGERLTNLKMWAEGKESMLKVRSSK